VTGVTGTLASFAAGLDVRTIPPSARHAAARLVLDTVGCMVAGSRTTVARYTLGWLTDAALLGSGGPATVVGAGRGALPVAAYANGRWAAVLDADETYPSDRQTSHLAAATLASALATAEARGGSRADLITAVVAGYEVGARLSDAMVPRVGNARGGLRAGWGPGSPLGATVAAGRAAGLDAPTIAQALGLAGTHVDPPPLQWGATSPAPMAKSADAGWHAWTAVSAAGMAAAGLTGYPTILDGERGLWRALNYEAHDEDAATDRLGLRWIVEDAAFKRWPCQYWMQPALTALDRVLDEAAIDAEAIERIELATTDKSLGPMFVATEPDGEIARAFSIPHAAAMIALRVPTGRAWSDDAMAERDDVRRLRRLVTVTRHPEADSVPSGVVDHQIRTLPARAVVRARGRDHVATVSGGLGSPWSDDTRLDDDALVEKFAEMTRDDLSPAVRAAVVDWVLGEVDRPIAELTACLADLPAR
jgi:2-methylcitrate dehydratase PrpD